MLFSRLMKINDIILHHLHHVRQIYIPEKILPQLSKHLISSSNEVKFNSSPGDKFLAWSKLKAFADDKINVT